MLSDITLSDKPSTQPFSQTGRPPDTGQQQLSNVPSPLANPADFPALNYRAALAGQSQDTRSRANQWTYVGEHDLETGSFVGEPELKISEAFKERLCVPWKKTLVVRLLGSNDQDYLNALTGGPWEILDHYLVVHQWSPTFRTSDKPHRSVVAWVQLPELPAHFYHREVLFALGNLLGRTVKLDYHTENLLRGKFARIAVDLDMTKPLATRIRLDGHWQQVVYENLPHICYDCGRIGHTEEVCPKKLTTIVPASTGEAQADMAISPAAPASEPLAGYGPWMQVVRKNRKTNKKGNSNRENLERNQSNNPAKSGNQGRSSPGKNPSQRVESKPRPNGQERKGKSTVVQDQKKGTKGLQKGKVKEIGEASTSEGRKDSNSQEWRVVGPLKDPPVATAQIKSKMADKDMSMGQTQASPKIDPKPDAGKQLPLLPTPTRSEIDNSENVDPNSGAVSVRQHYRKKTKPHSPLKEHFSKLSIQSTMKNTQGTRNNKRTSAKSGKAATFGITPQSIEDFITQTRQKEEEFQKLAMGASSDVSMREEIDQSILGTERFDKFEIVDAVGFSRGIWVLWDEAKFSISLMDSDTQFLHLRCFDMQDKEEVILIAVYAKPNEYERAPLWSSLRCLAAGETRPWILVGDFNSIRCPSERRGAHALHGLMAASLKDWIAVYAIRNGW
ncbi:unnamed protein product [Linum tenue]|uniref:CCHC-type domain-containing protein n=1 Tax=Linum tenue TaxID=586396 RepID=A0AAV0RMP7_9ROSI|nr:unnamed protein product [Linum tenue]